MKTLGTFAAVLTVIGISGCASLTTPGGATTDALCEAWGESLPSRSRADTPRTQDEIQIAYADFLNACPDHRHLIP